MVVVRHFLSLFSLLHHYYRSASWGCCLLPAPGAVCCDVTSCQSSTRPDVDDYYYDVMVVGIMISVASMMHHVWCGWQLAKSTFSSSLLSFLYLFITHQHDGDALSLPSLGFIKCHNDDPNIIIKEEKRGGSSKTRQILVRDDEMKGGGGEIPPPRTFLLLLVTQVISLFLLGWCKLFLSCTTHSCYTQKIERDTFVNDNYLSYGVVTWWCDVNWYKWTSLFFAVVGYSFWCFFFVKQGRCFFFPFFCWSKHKTSHQLVSS